MGKYIIAFRRSDNIGTEEYDGGNTIEDARKEGRFFRENLPKWVDVRICTHDLQGLHTKEYVK